MLDNARNASRKVREFTEGYDNDPRVLEVEIIDQRISSITGVELVKNSAPCASSLCAAESGSKSLAQVVKSNQPLHLSRLRHQT